MQDKNEIFGMLEMLEKQLEITSAQLSVIKRSFEDTLTENVTLRMELEKLRSRLSEIEEKHQNSGQNDGPNSALNGIYEEGFHVCVEFYGQRRQLDEPCAFCMGLLYR